MESDEMRAGLDICIEPRHISVLLLSYTVTNVNLAQP